MTTAALRSPIEERADTDSLEALHTRRRDLLAVNGRLIAMYGSFGHYDDHRKRFVEAQKIRVRMELSASRDKKPAEAEIDAAAYGSEAYERFLDNALAEKIDYLAVQNELDEIAEQIRSRELELQSYNAEIRLAR